MVRHIEKHLFYHTLTNMDKMMMMKGKAKEAKEMHNSRGKEVAERYMNQEKKKKEGGSAVVGG